MRDQASAAETLDLAGAVERLRRLEGRLEREHRARLEAERLLESKALELYAANRALSALAAGLELRVEERTRELSLERQRALERAEIDMLTGIANRASFSRQLDQTLAEAKADGLTTAALLIDLDAFKNVNDNFGHAAGDALLVAVARRLVDAVRPGDVVARLGGDEFVVIARTAAGNPRCPRTMAERLLRALCQPVELEGRSLSFTCSIGVAETTGTAGAAKADELLRNADLALYASKRAGRARVTVFEATLRDEVDRRAELDASVRQAVQGDRIEPWYQPIVRRSDGRCVGAEVLARLRTPGGEVLPPAAFLESVEALGLLDTMMEKVLERAFRAAAPLVGRSALDYLSINVSATQFNQGWVQTRLPALLAETGFPAESLVVEITENALLQDMQRTRGILQALTASGMRIALDDFGVGYSNFAMLRQLPFAILKLDRTLICDIETDAHALALAECILDLAARLEIKVVAEGVETRRHAELLALAGCDAMQGYWFARPGPGLAAWFPFGRPPAVLP